MSLKQLQVTMMDYIEDKQATDSESDEFVASVSENVVERMSIYQNGYRVRLTSLLKQAYPALLRLLGADAFFALSRDYMQAYPPRQGSVFSYGNELALFLAHNLGEQDAVVELARLEWVVHTLSRVASTPPLTLDDWKEMVESEQGESHHFSLMSSASLQELRYNTVETWQALVEKSKVPTSESKATVVLLWRNAENELIIEQLTPLATKLLKMLCNGLNLDQACDALASHYDDEDAAIADISAHLLGWIDRGVFQAA